MSKPNMELFASNLLLMRKSKGISARELAGLAGLRTQKRAFDIEEGRGSPDLQEVLAICQALHVSMDDMMTKCLIIEVKFIEPTPKHKNVPY